MLTLIGLNVIIFRSTLSPNGDKQKEEFHLATPETGEEGNVMEQVGINVYKTKPAKLDGALKALWRQHRVVEQLFYLEERFQADRWVYILIKN